MITVLDANSLYLKARAFSKQITSELEAQWNKPMIDAALVSAIAYIKGNPELYALAKKDPQISKLLEGE